MQDSTAVLDRFRLDVREEHFRIASPRPELVDRLVLFGAIARRDGNKPPSHFDAWRLVSLDAQWTRFTEDVPKGSAAVLSRRHFGEWGERYLDTEPASRTRAPPAV